MMQAWRVAECGLMIIHFDECCRMEPRFKPRALPPHQRGPDIGSISRLLGVRQMRPLGPVRRSLKVVCAALYENLNKLF